MKESANIANRFADAYLVAMLEGTSPEEVIRAYETSYPELGQTFRTEAKGIDLLYGYLRNAERPSESEIAAAYQKVQARMPATQVTSVVKIAQPGVLASIVSFFKVRPMTAGASFAALLALVTVLVLQPWSSKQPSSPVATTEPKETLSSPDTGHETDVAEAQGSKDQLMPQPAFRGSKSVVSQDGAGLDKKDRDRLAHLQSANSLSAPTGLKVLAIASDTVVIRWNPVKNALSYIVELKRANEGQFTAVSQTSQTQARLVHLPSERVEIRVIAASGERKGEASAAMNVTVP